MTVLLVPMTQLEAQMNKLVYILQSMVIIFSRSELWTLQIMLPVKKTGKIKIIQQKVDKFPCEYEHLTG